MQGGEKQGKVQKLSKGEVLMLNIGSMCTGARVIAVSLTLALRWRSWQLVQFNIYYCAVPITVSLMCDCQLYRSYLAKLRDSTAAEYH